jgi:hypothetical protein
MGLREARMTRPMRRCMWLFLLIAAFLYACVSTALAQNNPNPPPPAQRPGGAPPPGTAPQPPPQRPPQPPPQGVATPAPGAATTPPAGNPSNKTLDVPSLEPDPVDKTKSAKAPSKRDRDQVGDVFSVPSGTHPTDKQTEALKKLKEKKEPELKAAIKALDEATGTDKVIAARKLRDLKKDIRNDVLDIVDPPTNNTNNQQRPVMQPYQSPYQNPYQNSQQYRPPYNQNYNYNYRYR